MSRYRWGSIDFRDVREDEYPVSASAVKMFKRCEEQFRLKYREKRNPGELDSKHLNLGSAVHESIERVLLNNDIAELSDRPNQIREKMISEYGAINPNLSDEYYEAGIGCLNVASRYIAKQSPDGIDAVEHEFEFALVEPDSAFGGKIDIVQDGEIWDWKTGTNIYEEDELIQGMIYAMGYLHDYGEIPDKIKFIYLREDGDNDPVQRAFDPTDSKFEDMMEYVEAVVQAKKNDEFEPQPDSSKCYHCEYEGFCDASAVGTGGVRYEIF